MARETAAPPTVTEAQAQSWEASEKSRRPLRLREAWLVQRRRAALALRAACVASSRALRRNHARAPRRHRAAAGRVQRIESRGEDPPEPPERRGGPAKAADAVTEALKGASNVARGARVREARP